MSEFGDMPADPDLCPGEAPAAMITLDDPFSPFFFVAARPIAGGVALVGGPYPIDLSRYQAENLRDELAAAIALLERPGALPK